MSYKPSIDEIISIIKDKLLNYELRYFPFKCEKVERIGDNVVMRNCIIDQNPEFAYGKHLGFWISFDGFNWKSLTMDIRNVVSYVQIEKIDDKHYKLRLVREYRD